MGQHSESAKKKNIIIAIPTPSFADGLKKHFENEGLNVLEVFVVLEHLIEKIYQLKTQNEVQIDGIVISSSISKVVNDKRLEHLANVIETIRKDFSETSIVFLSDEPQGHPLLAELVSMGIYNIFSKSEKQEPLNIKELIKCFEKPKLYNEVIKYKDFNPDIKWRRSFVNGASSITINLESGNKTKNIESQKHKSVGEKTEQSKTEPLDAQTDISVNINDKSSANEKQNINKNHPTDIFEEEDDDGFWQLPPIQTKVVVRERIVGKSIIAVAGIEKGAGTTHTSILIANYLAQLKYSVKLIECNDHYEYLHIEKAYDGKNVDTNKAHDFEINGVTYVKATSDLDMSHHVTSDHSHIILDLGTYEDSPFIDEFYRANQQILVCSGAEWKQYAISQFIQNNSSSDQGRWVFLVPLSDSQTVSDIKNDHDDISIHPIPYHGDPFQIQENTNKQLSYLFDSEGTYKRKRLWIILSAIYLSLIIIAILLFIIF